MAVENVELPKQVDDTAGAKKQTVFDYLKDITEDNVDQIFAKSPVLASFKDKYFARNLEEWKKKNLEGYYNERYNKEHPPETEEQKRLRALEQKLNDAEKREQKQIVFNKSLKYAQENDIPVDFVDFIIGDNIDTIDDNLQKFNKTLQGYLQKIKSEILKVNGRGISKSDVSIGEKLYTRDQLNKLTPQEQEKNWEKVQKSLQSLK
jgi:hypothetical protein